MSISSGAARLCRMRKLLTVALAAAALALPAQIAWADDVPPVDTADCPKQLPAGADPAGWRCEVLTTDATAKIGALGQLNLGRQRLTFAEGTLDGQYAQVFGGLKAERTTVPGGLVGNDLIPLAFQVQYAGASDFNGSGFVNLKLKVNSPLLPRTCFIGSDEDPMVIRPQARQSPQPVPGHPELRTTTMQDNRFAIPRAHGCGVFTGLVEHRFGVPAAAGTNEITLPTYIFIQQYDASHR
jgi:hypothetical protein